MFFKTVWGVFFVTQHQNNGFLLPRADHSNSKTDRVMLVCITSSWWGKHTCQDSWINPYSSGHIAYKEQIIKCDNIFIWDSHSGYGKSSLDGAWTNSLWFMDYCLDIDFCQGLKTQSLLFSTHCLEKVDPPLKCHVQISHNLGSMAWKQHLLQKLKQP